MSHLGIYQTDKNERFVCYFSPEKKQASAIGPFFDNNVMKAKTFVEVAAETEEDAKNKLSEAMGNGDFENSG